ncbi:uncharacterized protein L969DRAFT_54047 [Mixia osmundae IAM 14324]|uniref:Mitochondrial distribution and morphology protein 10 n=1 Tax=Mixia osmundae (strain CBS 9802 / IAM 14324 / JCM 22182 / KY 12970) TaxID=764103 RepID=G7E2N1_MIXOS|nr:uncharacterized protein L969DRAFT_54047 [Mixia osmundae IAM 14324]KEI36956.1 hypothetical protein L969DRAFT_54047 [Mixia osmundae IAM 14324]GAA97091.1 hypothetical protein E5Q_03766 [Mixia osmundae IAM 14324]
MMVPFPSHVLRLYYLQMGWDEHNHYANLTRSSRAILDFAIPAQFGITISKAPLRQFSTSAALTAPSLRGSLAYLFIQPGIDIGQSGIENLKELGERFRVPPLPSRPVMNSGRGEYFLYGKMHLPTNRLDALYLHRLSPTVLLMSTLVSMPPSLASRAIPLPDHDPPPSSVSKVKGQIDTNLVLCLQQDRGRWSSEYSYSAADGLVGARFLHNLAISRKHAVPIRPRRIDEDVDSDVSDTALRGRFSLGAEVFFSAQEKSAGVSTGVRFSTLPDEPSQPPTVITATFNPIMGHISAAYGARASPDLALCSKFDFNIYSYDSNVTMGAEWWHRRRRMLRSASTTDKTGFVQSFWRAADQGEVIGCLKARASTTSDVALLWESRLHNCLIGFGVKADLTSRARPIKAVGLDLKFFSSD